MDQVDEIITQIRSELVTARAKFPGDRLMTIALAEEFGELCKAILDEDAFAIRREAIQTAVMAIRVALDGDGSVKEWREEHNLGPVTIHEACENACNEQAFEEEQRKLP